MQANNALDALTASIKGRNAGMLNRGRITTGERKVDFLHPTKKMNRPRILYLGRSDTCATPRVFETQYLPCCRQRDENHPPRVGAEIHCDRDGSAIKTQKTSAPSLIKLTQFREMRFRLL